jgi:hypothetical protein
MPSINEVWEQAVQANANLARLHDDMVSLGTCCSNTNSKLQWLINLTTETNDWQEELFKVANNGFAAISSGIQGIHDRQELMSQLLLFMAEQQNTMICALEKISSNTCRMLNHSAEQTALQRYMADHLYGLEHMYATSNPEAALVYRRHSEAEEKMRNCCPSKPSPPECQQEPCSKPIQPKSKPISEFTGYQPIDPAVNRVKSDQLD